MRYEEQKTLNYLQILEIRPHEGITVSELKKQYLVLAKKYHPDTASVEYKDGTMFYTMKNAYDYLYDHIDLVHEAVGHYLHPETDVHEEQRVEEAPHIEEEMKQDSFYRATNGATIVFVDKPSILNIIFSLISPIMGFFMYFLHKKRMPKSARTYLLCGIIGLGIGVLLLFL